jgi:putative transposase
MSDLLYRRRLPHWIRDGKAVHLRFRLDGSRPEPGPEILLKDARTKLPAGPTWLSDCRVANVVVNTLRYGSEVRGWYQVYSYVIMPNHVHILLEPSVELARITQWSKGRTARVCNRLLGRSGAFWQDESYDHWIRCYEELEETARYIENNPVRAGLVRSADQWKWSSAAGCCAAGQTTKNDGLPYGGNCSCCTANCGVGGCVAGQEGYGS